MVQVPLLYQHALVNIHEHNTFYNPLCPFYNPHSFFYNLGVDYTYNDRLMRLILRYNMMQLPRRLKLLRLDLYPTC